MSEEQKEETLEDVVAGIKEAAFQSTRSKKHRPEDETPNLSLRFFSMRERHMTKNYGVVRKRK